MAIVTVDATDARLSPESLATAIGALRTDGVVVLENAVDPGHTAILRDRLFEDLEKYLGRPNAPFNWNRGNVQQDPPPFEPFLFRDILLNEAAISVAHGILGQGMYNAFYSGNTAVKSESRQPVHADTGQLWTNMEHPHPPVQIVVNVAMVDFSPENGSTEIWPGTHLDPTVTMQSGDIEVPDAQLEARRKIVPPIQPVVKAGSLILRDIRLWHAGMPNRTDTPRPMVAMIYSVAWWPSGRLKFPASSRALFHHPLLETRADFVDGEIDYVAAPSAYAFREN
ncbi:hypothetical protein EON81_04290 [bacterium]|nr:MAG: hypothetical protein EON81_04290 [bacterium]